MFWLKQNSIFISNQTQFSVFYSIFFNLPVSFVSQSAYELIVITFVLMKLIRSRKAKIFRALTIVID